MVSVRWKDGSLVSIKLRDNLYTIGLLKRSPYMWVFDINNETGTWKNIDLNQVKPLCCVGVVQVVMRKMVVGKIDPKDVLPPDSLPIPSHWIVPLNWMDWSRGQGVKPDNNFPWHGGKLIALDPNIGSIESPIVKPI